MKLYKIISILLSWTIAVTALSVAADAKSAKIEDVPITTESVELAEPEKMVPDSFDKVPKLVLRSIDILINIDEVQNRTTLMFGNDSIVTGVKYNGVEKISYTYDLLKRQTAKTINTTNPFVTQYQYKNIYNYRTSTLIDKISYSNDRPYIYAYDANGNITSISTETNGAQSLLVSYEYDALNQLVRTNDAEHNVTTTYTYDNGGNICSVKTYAYTTGALGTAVSEKIYTYGNTEWKDLLTAYNGTRISYDTIGNPLNWVNGEQFTWGGGRQLTGITKGDNTVSYTYNDSGIRTSKTVNGVRTDYYLNGTAIIMQKTGDNVIWYTYDENGNIAGMNYNGSDYWFYRNAQNDVIGIVDSSGAVVAKYTYDDWGKITAVTDGQGNDISANETHIANINPIRYRGYYYDAETGLYYINSRYYDADVCRFVSADTHELITASLNALTDKNLFAYCDNNPIVRADNCGEFWHIAVGAIIGATFNAVSSVASQLIENGGNFSKINLGVVFVNAAAGALSGALAATGIGLAASVAANAAISMGSNAASQVITNKGFDNFDVGDMVLDGVIGGISGAAGGRGMQKSANIKTLGKRFTKKVLSGDKKIIAKGAKYYLAHTRFAYKKYLISPIKKSTIVSFVGGVAKKAIYCYVGTV